MYEVSHKFMLKNMMFSFSTLLKNAFILVYDSTLKDIPPTPIEKQQTLLPRN